MAEVALEGETLRLLEIARGVSPDGLGPRGGDLNHVQNPQARDAHHNGVVQEDGTIGMHSTQRHIMAKRRTATNGIMLERPWHRLAAIAMLAGVPDGQIAQSQGVALGYIACLKGQLWFQELLAKLVAEQGAGVLGLIKREAAASVEKIVELRDNAESETVQLKAATTILEHAEGKPTVKIEAEVSNTSFESAADELSSVLQELATLEAMQAKPKN